MTPTAELLAVHRRLIGFVIFLITLAGPRPAVAQERGAAALGDAIAGIGVTARVLMIGAHPDDEDTYLLTWLARGRHVETAYLSLTRGDGGQNLIGNELGEGLGAIRTEELLAARRIDGARQFFTRAYDFGFSKSADETYTHWPRDSILLDVVTVVRSFKPHVIVAVFSGTPRDGHGHHQVSGQLAREAFATSGDTVRFPRAMTAGHGGWTPLKLYQTARFNPEQATLGLNVGEYDPLVGRTYAELAAESRSQHKSQGFGTAARRGEVMGYVRREQSRVAAPANASDETSIFDGIDIGWGRLAAQVSRQNARAALDSLPSATAAVLAAYDAFEPEQVIGPLARVQQLLGRVCEGFTDRKYQPPPCLSDRLWRSFRTPDGASLTRPNLPPDVKRSLVEQGRRVNRALLIASGVLVEATAERELWAAGEMYELDLSIFNRGSDSVAIELGYVSAPPTRRSSDVLDRDQVAKVTLGTVAPDSVRHLASVVPLDGVTKPWWLAHPRQRDMFVVPIDELSEDQRPIGPQHDIHLSIGDARFIATAPVIHRFGDPVRGEVRRPIAAVPAISPHLDREVEYAPANTSIDREVHVLVRSAADSARTATVELRLPAGLTAEPASRTVVLSAPGASATVTFRLRGRVAPGRHEIAALARSGADMFTTGFSTIDYDHLRPRRLYRDATIAMQAVDVRLPPGLTVGYLAGVGDNVAPMLRQLGIPVTEIDPATMDRESLSRYRTVVVGPRAYEAQPALAANNHHLLDYARAGGTVVVQYGQYEMQRPGILPYGVTLSRPHARVTVEETPVRILAPGHPLLTTPNRLATSDFDGWVQERSLYMPVEAAPEWQTLLSVNDPAEAANDHSILVAPYGDGVYVYTTLAFFRQLPAGNPGAARLFVNLLGAGESIRP